MCGIVGFLNPGGLGASRETLRRSLELLAERGPDDVGWLESPDVLLGHRRLSIMDPSPAGHQPMSNDDGSIWLTFNGEIYGFRELRGELERRGHRFRSSCDTEVIVRGYEEWGREVLARIDGMFAFGLYDGRSRTLLLARDRLGKKPLFWARRGTFLGFASLLRPLVAAGLADPVLSVAKLREFLFFNYTLGPHTIFRDVQLLAPGTWLECRDGEIRTGCYWSLRDAEPAFEPGDPRAQERFEALLEASVSRRLVSDVPLGVFLSGGVDSALVTALASRAQREPLATFSVGFAEPSFDERPKARRVAEALGTRHQEIACEPGDVPGLLRGVTASADHLLADQSLVPLAKLARVARRSVKVVLTGDGGDELLAGYATYRALALARRYVRWVPGGLRGTLEELAGRLPASPSKASRLALAQRFFAATGGDLERAHASWRSIWSHAEISRLLCGRGDGAREWRSYAERMGGRCDWTWLQRAVHADLTTWLVDSILAKVDRATMAVGLEARSPLLDSRLVSFCFATLLRDPASLGKGPLRRLVARRLGPDFAALPKEGFQTPFAGWFRGELRPYLRRSLTALEETLPGLFDAALLREVEAEHADGRRDHALKLWSLVALSEWMQLYPGLTADSPAADPFP